MNNTDIMNQTINDNILSDIVEKNSEEHIDGNAYSAEYMKSQLIKKMQEVSKNIKKLMGELQKNEEVKKQLLVELRKNEKIFNELINQVEVLNKNLDSSVDMDRKRERKDVERNDDKLVGYDRLIAEKQQQLNSLGMASNGLSARRFEKRKEKLENELKRLKEKRGKIEERQKKLVNTKLEKYYKKLSRKSTSYGKTHATEELRMERNSELEQKKKVLMSDSKEMAAKAEFSGKFSGSLYSLGSQVSYKRAQLLDKYCKFLSMKDGVLNSFRRVDKKVLNEVHFKYGQYFADGARVDVPVNDGGSDIDISADDIDVIENVDTNVNEQVVVDTSVNDNGDIDLDEGQKLEVPLGADINSVVNSLMMQKRYGIHCYAIINDIKLDNLEYDTEEEMLESYNDYLDENSKGVSR